RDPPPHTARSRSRSHRASARRGRSGSVRRRRAADRRQRGRTRGSRRARAAARAEPTYESAALSRKAIANPGTDAPIAYEGVGRCEIARDQKPRSVGWYSHSYAMNPTIHATIEPGRSDGPEKIRSGE